MLRVCVRREVENHITMKRKHLCTRLFTFKAKLLSSVNLEDGRAPFFAQTERLRVVLLSSAVLAEVENDSNCCRPPAILKLGYLLVLGRQDGWLHHFKKWGVLVFLFGVFGRATKDFTALPPTQEKRRKTEEKRRAL